MHPATSTGALDSPSGEAARSLAEPLVRDFEAFYVKEHVRLYRALCLVTGDRQEAEDAMHDAFIRLFERWDRVGGLDDPVGYLYRTALNRVRMAARRARVAARRVAARAGSADALREVDERDRMDRALAALTVRQRAAIVLMDLYRFTSPEAGRILGVSPVTVRRLAGNARTRLRETLEDSDE